MFIFQKNVSFNDISLSLILTEWRRREDAHQALVQEARSSRGRRGRGGGGRGLGIHQPDGPAPCRGAHPRQGRHTTKVSLPYSTANQQGRQPTIKQMALILHFCEIMAKLRVGDCMRLLSKLVLLIVSKSVRINCPFFLSQLQDTVPTSQASSSSLAAPLSTTSITPAPSFAFSAPKSVASESGPPPAAEQLTKQVREKPTFY